VWIFANPIDAQISSTVVGLGFNHLIDGVLLRLVVKIWVLAGLWIHWAKVLKTGFFSGRLSAYTVIPIPTILAKFQPKATQSYRSIYLEWPNSTKSAKNLPVLGKTFNQFLGEIQLCGFRLEFGWNSAEIRLQFRWNFAKIGRVGITMYN
jgi:hypothetical protein